MDFRFLDDEGATAVLRGSDEGSFERDFFSDGALGKFGDETWETVRRWKEMITRR